MLISFPLMVVIQEISARVGRVTGRGLAGNICRHYPGWLLQSLVVVLFAANAINIADLGAMADAMRLLAGGPETVYVPVFSTSPAAYAFSARARPRRLRRAGEILSSKILVQSSAFSAAR
jgi:Mn2+/Fe2+ NRAMP family transporter